MEIALSCIEHTTTRLYACSKLREVIIINGQDSKASSFQLPKLR